jgi:hypothetical protein
MPTEQVYVKGQQAKMYAQRVKTRKRMNAEFQYPFGLLSIVDLMDRALNFRGAKTKRQPSRQVRKDAA